jgi:lipopolysaccharide/colanic/teichoic acid biosynthesis glycosyltransferase
MMKRLVDFFAALLGLLVASPVLIPVMFLVWREDKHSPFYIAPRVGKNDASFRMVKMRSMVINADKSGVDSTSANDDRITPVGQFIRRYKLDELTQLWNVLLGDMSLVGPRPNVKNETDLYTAEERRLLSVKPGITDFSSIVFSDEGEILADSEDPDLDYNQLIRPWKSRLGLVYVEHQSLLIDVKLVVLTVISIINRPAALAAVNTLLTGIGADEDVVRVSLRCSVLVPSVPPGSDKIVAARGRLPA